MVSLLQHPRGYSLSSTDLFNSALRIFSGYPYAERHFEMMQIDKEHTFGHKMIGTIQSTPFFVGLLAALAERVVVLVYTFFFPPKLEGLGQDNGQDFQDVQLRPVKRQLVTPKHIPPINVALEKDQFEVKTPERKQPRLLREELGTPKFETPIKRVLPQRDERHRFSSPLNAEFFVSKKEGQTGSPIKGLGGVKAEEAGLGGSIKFLQGPILEKLYATSRSAFNERLARYPEFGYATIEAALPSEEELLKGEMIPLKFEISSCEDQGRRKSMEDKHFFYSVPGYVFAGVFDGHGGVVVAEWACGYFNNLFIDLSLLNGDVVKALDKIFKEVSEDILKIGDFAEIGSTAVVSVIEEATNLVYTASLGDSQSVICRNGSVIPLSPLRDWKNQEEADRASRISKNPKFREEWPKAEDAKELYFELPGDEEERGINVARAFGDGVFGGVVSAEHEITINKLRPGDTLVLACDGLMDFPAREIYDVVKKNRKKEELADALADYALIEKEGDDNVTVIAIKVEAK